MGHCKREMSYLKQEEMYSVDPHTEFGPRSKHFFFQGVILVLSKEFKLQTTSQDAAATAQLW